MSFFGLIGAFVAKKAARLISKKLTRQSLRSAARTTAAVGAGALIPSPFPSFGLPDPRRGLPGAAVAGAAGVCPAGFHLDKATRTRCVRNRRMNFANGHAAKRSLRRIKGTMKLLKGIEKEIGKAAPRRRAPAPRRHHQHLHHD